MKLTLAEAAPMMGGVLSAGGPGEGFSGVSIDSRTIRAGELFFAIVGKHQDGHRFVKEALGRGASCVVVSASVPVGPEVGVIRVSDTTVALQELAGAVRRQAGLKVVAITGSMGKTTTKEATAAALSARFSVLKSEGNLNNLYGLPLSLLRYAGEEAAALELGMSAPGEIRRLASIALPDVGVLTNVAEVHREFFPSLEAIAEAKGELFSELPSTGVAVVNADDPLVMSQARRFVGRTIPFGLGVSAELRADAIERTPRGMRFSARDAGGQAFVECVLVGHHNVYNLLAALGAARALGLSLEEASRPLAALRPASHRGERIRFREGFLVIDETYNANPKAVEAALDALQSEPAERRIAVLGDMREVGSRAEVLHRESGRKAAESGVLLLIGVGPLGKFIVEGGRAAGMAESQLRHADAPELAGALLAEEVRAGDVILLKASRGVALERAVAMLSSRFHAEVR